MIAQEIEGAFSGSFLLWESGWISVVLLPQNDDCLVLANRIETTRFTSGES